MFKQRKNKTFKYEPRFSKENQTGADDTPETKDFVSKWRRQNRNEVQVKGALPVKTLILALVLLLLCMYVLEKKYM